jgi:hypothetical protein
LKQEGRETLFWGSENALIPKPRSTGERGKKLSQDFCNSIGRSKSLLKGCKSITIFDVFTFPFPLLLKEALVQM